MDNNPATNKRKPFGNAFYIGLISFFGGISQDIFIPILPLYLTNVLHLDKSFIGITEGIVTSSASIFKVASGYISDKLRARKKIVFFGYFLSLVSRPLLALVGSGFGVLALRFFDGVGKGIKESPKDALIADTTTTGSRGREFGVVMALDTLGSVAGPLLLFALLYFLRDNSLKYHYIFFITAVPLVATLSILSFKVREAQVVVTPAASRQDPSPLKLPVTFYLFIAIMVVFSLGNSSDTFLILRSQNLGVSILGIPLVYALFNFCYASASIPLGSLSDRIGREKVLLLGWLAYALSYLGFALATHAYQAWLLFAFYGLYYATAEGVGKAMIADLVPSEKRGTAYGLYNTVIGLVTLPASFIAGLLWDRVGSSAPFFFGAAVTAVASVLLFTFMQWRRV
jgi:MFS family permease